MAAIRFCLLACLLIAAIAPLANGRAKREVDPSAVEAVAVEDVEAAAEVVREKRSTKHLRHCGGKNEPACGRKSSRKSSRPKKTCRTVWEEKTTP
jgi:hypothetical protein